MFDSRANASALLHSVFGFNAYRPGQEEIVDAVRELCKRFARWLKLSSFAETH